MSDHGSEQDSGVVETLQSLIVAFVLAMTFRGFVAEGFVIPTGSMAPTLMGQHLLMRSEATGYTFPVGLDLQLQSGEAIQQRLFNLVDPMIGPGYRGGGWGAAQIRPRMGDRILVLKSLYPFTEPERFDVVVFKNPTDPMGDSANYIKRLIGLPNETIWLADGDVFARQRDDAAFRVQRKPEHVQRSLWQPIHHSDYAVVNTSHLSRPYMGPPWVGRDWDTTGRAYRTSSAEPTMLEWRNSERRLDDWTPYNMLGGRHLTLIPVSDLRIAAGVVADQEGLNTRVELEARGHVFEFALRGGDAIVRYRPSNAPADWIAEDRQSVSLAEPGSVTNVEFWHVDQTMAIYIDGERVAYLEYEWSPMERLQHATGSMENEQALAAAGRGLINETSLRWHFEGSPVTLHRVRVDRDLYYRSASLESNRRLDSDDLSGPGFGTHPDRLATLGPDHFFMLGDNSQASLDSRLWGYPHELIATQVDPAPFVVNRRLLLGKAWVVYFPAPHPVTDGGINIVPDFGRLRYIR